MIAQINIKNLSLTQKLLILSSILKTVVFTGLIIGELNSLWSGSEYRFQYLLILYFILPGLGLLGVVEYFGLIKLKLQKNVLATFPFITGVIIYLLLMNFEGILNLIQLSWVMIISFALGIILAIIVSIKTLKAKK